MIFCASILTTFNSHETVDLHKKNVKTRDGFFSQRNNKAPRQKENFARNKNLYGEL